ncbi:GDSL-type esterase/lipase family protein [Synechococcus sp. CBW1006]|uniref:GDSL-type esterase/lipase family protein n=1 Tax=Synechococcus sp. CBW1006 TaxID=1353138 RepID=UPI0018CFE5E1|nr:GDSL-type esterase/lipase family protein [Synechococcus sp. CBW1006]QPN65940.1 hypothetical protein H8F26_13900 [Synechococcus sp. CBW1006]
MIALLKGVPSQVQQRQDILRDVQPSDVTFIGDSITAQGLWSEYFSDGFSVANRGFPSATTADVLNQLPSLTATNARLYLLMMGVNDVLATPLTPRQIADNLLAIRTNLLEYAPRSRVIVQSTLECRLDFCGVNALESIREINGYLEAQLPPSSFLDLNHRLVDGSGLRAVYTYDGVHLNSKGYRIWRSLVHPVILQEIRTRMESSSMSS